MLRISRRTVLMVLLAISLFSVALRYPLVDHERYQADSYYVHILAGSIADEHRMKWALSPTSYFGYYPLSYPSGIPMILAETSAVTGLGIEACILLFGWIVGIALVLGAFLIAREVLVSTGLSLFCALIVTISPRIVDTTYWVGSARTPLVLMMIFLFFLVSRQAQDTVRWKIYIGLAIIIVAASAAIHHAAVLLLVFGMVYVLSAIMVAIARFKSRRDTRVKRAIALYSTALVAGITLTYFGVLGISQASMEGTVGILGETPSGFNMVVATFISYFEQMSIGLVLGVFGVWYLLTKRFLTPKTVFVPLVIPAFIPIMGKTLYLSPVLTPFIAIVVAQGYLWTWNRKMLRPVVRSLVILLLVVSLCLPSTLIDHWNNERYPTNDAVEVGDDVVLSAIYLGANYPGQPFIWNNEVLGSEVAAFSGSPKVGGGILAMIADLVDVSSVKNGTIKNDWPQSMYQWQIWPGEQDIGDGLIYMINYNGADTGLKTYVDRFVKAVGNRTDFLFMVDQHAYTNFTNIYSMNPSKFASGALDGGMQGLFSSYVTYRDERVAWYFIHFEN